MPHCRDLPSLRFAHLGPRTQLPSFARVVRTAGAKAPTRSSKRHALATCPSAASTRAVATLGPVALPVSDTRGHAVALAGATALSWEELPVLAGGGLTRANSDERLDGVEPGGRTAPFSRSRSAGGRGAGLPPRPRGFPTGSEFEPSADAHHRRAPGVDRADDLLGVDPLEVHAGRGHIRMPELALDHR